MLFGFRILAFDFSQVPGKTYPESWDKYGMAAKNLYYKFMGHWKDELPLRIMLVTFSSKLKEFQKDKLDP